MTSTVSISVRPEEEKDGRLIQRLLLAELKKQGIKIESPSDVEFAFERRSIDARRKRIRIFLRYKAYVGESPESDSEKIPVWQDASGSKKKVVIVGAGPAGLFGALKLLEHGIRPVIVERGRPTSARKVDIAAISTRGIVSPDSNYCFGEGGAGAFSDGKLFTRSTKRGDVGMVYRILVHFGADKKILTDSHPHVGTNKLPQIINNIRKFIISKGGQFLFGTRCTDIVLEKEGGSRRVTAIRVINIEDNTESQIPCDALVLATGHSASDIYLMLARQVPSALEAKTFAMGVRVEHPRPVIDRIQFHGRTEVMAAAEYRLTSQQEGRGVYSFCMCPGGFVVPSASGAEEIVVNGMSAERRNSRWSNAAIVVETRPEDVPAEFAAQAEGAGSAALSGLFYRSHIERLARQHGRGQAAPAQRLSDFLAGRLSSSLPESSYTPGLVSSELQSWLPSPIALRLAPAFRDFDSKMRGFICDDALLIAPETRTSTPVRILRGEKFECVAARGLYPAGEGSGYSGGIVSSALDGMNVCAAVAEN